MALPAEYGQIDIRSVSKWFPAARRRETPTHALNAVSVFLDKGEIGILLGASGCGKSTLLRMTAGLESIEQGRILVSGAEVKGPGRDRGMVFQSYTSFPWLTVEQNVAYGLKINGDLRAEREGVVAYFLEQVGLTRFKDYFPDQLSGGMRQRVAIARALANQPAVLLLDEPFGALDPETRQQMQELLFDIVRRERMTVLMVTHDVEEAVCLGDQINFLSSRPGTLRRCLQPQFAGRTDRLDKESLMLTKAYQDLYQEVRQMMRDENHRLASTDTLA